MSKFIEVHQYVDQKKELYNHLMAYIDDEQDTQDYFSNLTTFLNSAHIPDNKNELTEFLSLLSNLCSNHHHHSQFQKNILNLLIFLENKIKQTFSKDEIKLIFKNYAQAELFLYNKKIITQEERIADTVFKTIEYIDQIKEENEYLGELLSKFHKEILINDNFSKFIQSIENDSLDDFTSLLSKMNIDISKEIMFMDENPFLKEQRASSLIELSSFYGSYKIFNYLKTQNSTYKKSVWEYAIHGNNLKIIELLDFYQLKHDSEFAEKCLEIAIKCHHNKIVKYLIDKNLFINQNDDNNYENNLIAYAFHYINYDFIPNDFESNKFILFYLCQFNYLEIVKLLVKENKDLNLNETIVYKEQILILIFLKTMTFLLLKLLH